MKRNFLAILLCCLCGITIVRAENEINIIPKPSKVEIREGSFAFSSKSTRIFAASDPAMRQEAEFLNNLFNTYIEDYTQPVYTRNASSHTNMDNSIIFILTDMKDLSEEGYVLDISTRRITIEANTTKGFFYGIQTLLQMMKFTPHISNQKHNTLSLSLPACRITDSPRFAYRGKHLDCARHFFSIDYLKKYLDILAFHKINTFHWHLTDDQGWRIEIKSYPLLTEIGSKRKETLVGHYSDTPEDAQVFDGKEYSGFYTQEQARELVAYAAARHITIIPEIEIPGHAMAAISAYPEISCKGEKIGAACTWGVFEDVMCSKEETFRFLEGVLDEICDIFPSEYIHIGGDECPSVRWRDCDICQANIKRLGLKDETQLQGYFTRRVETYLQSKGRKIIGWDEILEKGVEKTATILSWQGEMGGTAAAKQGNDAIMVPSAYLYFNFYQGVAETEPLAIGGYSPLRKVYLYDPVPKELTKEQAKHIKGMQACTWTEYITNEKSLEYSDFPRMSALSERAWSNENVRDYDDFVSRLNHMLDCYDRMNINYSTSHFAVTADLSKKKDKIQISLSSPLKDGPIYYTLDGSVPKPSNNASKYSKPITIKQNTTLKAFAFNSERRCSPVLTATYKINKATGKTYIQSNINPQYTGGTKYALTDGLVGDKKSYDRWVGTLGKDYDVTLDLENTTDINYISINFLDEEGSWIFLPKNVKAYVSDNNKDWTEIPASEFVKSPVENNPKVVNYKSSCKKLKEKKWRFVRIFAESIGNCPDNHPGRGYGAHTFADEIEIN